MVRQTGRTDAESFWDDDKDAVSSDEKCEQYLTRQQKLTAAARNADDSVEEDEDDDEDVDDAEDTEAADADEADGLGTEPDDDDDNADDDADDEEPEAHADSSESTALSEASEEALTPRGSKMAKKSATGTKTKADHIREIIAAKQAAGAEFRPRDIIAALEKRGVEVNASQVSITMRNMGIPASRGGGKPKTKAAKPSEGETPPETSRATLKRKTANSDESSGGFSNFDAQDLEAAVDFINKVGGHARAKSLLDVCHKFAGRI